MTAVVPTVAERYSRLLRLLDCKLPHRQLPQQAAPAIINRVHTDSVGLLMPHIFISYAWIDGHEYAEKLERDLQATGYAALENSNELICRNNR